MVEPAQPDDKPAMRFARLPLGAQRELVARIAERRSRELQRRHPDVVGVWTGNRSRGSKLTTEPSLIFVVRAKKTETTLTSSQVLPKTLRAYTLIDGQKRSVLVPTDVIEVDTFGRATPDRAASPIEVLVPDHPIVEGQLCCAVRRPTMPSQILAISCRHVLTSPSDLADGRFSAARIFLANDAAEAPHVVEGTMRGGGIVAGSSNGPFSFDAQLASANPAALDRLRAALGDLALAADWPKAKGDLAINEAFIQTRRGAIRANFHGVGPSVAAINYAGIAAFHEEILFFELADGERTRPGDSGSPVTAEPGGGRLLGMHIAADNGKSPPIAYAIPAWRILRPQNYPGGSTNEQWELVPTTTLPAAVPQPVVTATPVPLDIAPPEIPQGQLTDDYRNQFAKFAMAAGMKLAGVSPVNPTVVAAQCILETAWGTNAAARNDHAYFGIKATGQFAGTSVAHRTTEHFGAGPETIVDHFRAYDHWWHSFLDYGNLIAKAARYARARASAGSALAYSKAIKDAGYATDPAYVDKIRKIVNARPAILGGPI